MKIKNNIWKLYAIKGLMWFMLAMPIIVLFFQENGLNLKDVMILQGSYSIMVALMEIPSGYIADVFGRKKTLILGTIFCFIGFSVFSFSFNFWEFLIAEILLGIGNSFISGSDSAILYDSLLEINKESEYTKIEGKTYSIGNFSEATAGILGGFLADISLRYPWYLQIFIAALAIPFAFSLIEPTINSKNKIKRNLKEIFKIINYSILKNKKLKWLMFFSAIIGVATLSIAWFAQPFFKEVGVPIKWFGILWAILNFSVGFSSYHSYRIESLLNKTTILFFIAISISFSFGMLAYSETKTGIIWIIIIYLIRGIATPILKNYINQLASSEIRATILSIRSFIIRFAFAIIAPFIGWIADQHVLNFSFLILGLLVGLISIICSLKIYLLED